MPASADPLRIIALNGIVTAFNIHCFAPFGVEFFPPTLFIPLLIKFVLYLQSFVISPAFVKATIIDNMSAVTQQLKKIILKILKIIGISTGD